MEPSMLNIFLILVPLHCALSQTSGTSDCNLQNADSLTTPGQRLDTAYFSSSAAGVIECAQLCVRRSDCKSLNYNKKAKWCELNKAADAGDGRTFVKDPNYVYSDIELWPSQTDPNCYARPCGHGEICIPGQMAGGAACSYTCFKRAPLGSTCVVDGDCNAINGSCINNKCLCGDFQRYEVTMATCVKDCGPGWEEFEDKCYYFGTIALDYQPESVKSSATKTERHVSNTVVCC